MDARPAIDAVHAESVDKPVRTDGRPGAAQMPVVAYGRVSTEDQNLSLAAQTARFQAYALAQDLAIVRVESDLLSGKNVDRPGLQRALALLGLGEGQARGLLVAKLDRLTRDVGDFNTLRKEYFDGRFALLSVYDHVDTRTATGRLHLNITMAVAQWERETIAERTRDALAHLRATGGGTPRLEGIAVARIMELAADGHSTRAIAAALTKDGVATLRGRGAWASSTVAKVLARVKTAGGGT